MKKLLFFFLLFCSRQLGAQTLSVSGSVADQNSGKPVEFASIQVLNYRDSSVAGTTATDKRGRFLFANLAPGKYLLRCSFISYANTFMPLDIAAGQHYNAGIIRITSLPQTMNEVKVISKRSLLNTSIDRKVYNVGQDIMAQSGSVSDVLRNVPSVEVDIDGGVSLRGSSEVMILINGKPSPMMGKSRAEVLQQIPAHTIERIEVITNPSARFRPDGTAGIINLVLKKNTKAGWNGTLSASAGNDDRYNGSVNLNGKVGKTTLFGSYGMRQDYRTRVNTLDRTELNQTMQMANFYKEQYLSVSRPFSNLVSLGTEFAPGDRNTFGAAVNYSHRDMTRNDVSRKFFYNAAHALVQQYDRLRYDPEYEVEKDATFSWEHNFKKEDRQMRLEYTLSRQHEQEENHFTNQYSVPAVSNSFDNSIIWQRDNENQITLDYSDPISENTKLELGYDGSFNRYEPKFTLENYDAGLQKFITDITRSNSFIHREKLNAVYGTWQQSSGKLGWMAGLRVEYSAVRSDLVSRDSVIDNNYLKIYPTLHLSYALKTGELQLNYSRRVHRPEADDLNPFPEYMDPRNLRAGNPHLLPEIIHSIEMGYKWQDDKYSFVPSLYYRYKQNGFTQLVSKINDSTFLTTQQNLSSDVSAGTELIFSAKPAKYIQANLSTNLFWQQIDGEDLGFTGKRSVVSMSSNLNCTIHLAPATMFQLSGNYRSARLTPQGKSFGSVVCNAGVRQDLFHKKVSAILTGSDLFKSLKEKREIDTPVLKQMSIGTRNARIFYLGLSWHFGSPKKPQEEKMQFDNNL